jgi:organic hydroperoxide reductase OsmC/OhrA
VENRFRASLSWTRTANDKAFLAGEYSRGHTVSFEGGPQVRGTASHHVVGKNWAEPGAIDPEQMLVAAIASCHMLTYLHVAREQGFIVNAYEESAEGIMEANASGNRAVTRVYLQPDIRYSGAVPSAEQTRNLHQAAHRQCFIANSVQTEIIIDDVSPSE